MTAAPDHTVAYTAAEARVDLAAAHRLAVLDDLHEASWNHFSLVIPDAPERILITPPRTHWSLVTAGSLVDVGPDDGERLREEDEELWIAYRIHYPLHQARTDAACVLHVHPPYCTALASLADGRLRPAEQNAIELYRKIAYNDRYDLLGEPDLSQGAAMADALGVASILFLRSHGVIGIGATVGVAYTNVYLLERACRVQLIARATGQPLASIAEAGIDRLSVPDDPWGYKWRNFEALKERLDPSYAAM